MVTAQLNYIAEELQADHEATTLMPPCSPEATEVPSDARRPPAFMSRALGMAFQLDLGSVKTAPRSLRTQNYDSESTTTSPEHDALADFELGQVLGSGTNGVVYAATARLSQGAFIQGQQVAVKIQGGRVDDEQREFAREEYEFMSQLEHPAIVPAFALYGGEVTSTIVMELCTGCLYNHVLDHGALTEAHTALLARQLFEGVNFLHSKRIVHRDIKPENLLLKNTAQVLKITDFNSAKQIGSWSCVMLSPRGTPQYYSPEVHLSHDWNELVDEWGCGLCIFYMVRGMLPFDITCPETAAVFECGRMPTLDWGDNPSAPSKMMRNLILQCLTVNMHDRPLVMELLLHPGLTPLPVTETAVDGDEFAGRSSQDGSSPSGGAFNRAPTPEVTGLDADSPTSLRSLQLDPQGDGGYPPHRRSKRVSLDADDLDDVSAPSMADAWRERRNGAETLQRLANRRTERTMQEGKDDGESPSLDANTPAATMVFEDLLDSFQEIDLSRLSTAEVQAPKLRPRNKKASVDKKTRYFTTHAASHLE